MHAAHHANYCHSLSKCTQQGVFLCFPHAAQSDKPKQPVKQKGEWHNVNSLCPLMVYREENTNLGAITGRTKTKYIATSNHSF